MRGITLIAIAAIFLSCSLGGGVRNDLPPVERLHNAGSYTVIIDSASGREGEYAVPFLDGPYPSVVLANDASSNEDQVKEEARILARHGFAALAFIMAGEDPVREFARAGSTVVTQPRARTAEAALVLLSGDPLPAIDVQRRLAGYRVLVLVDPGEPPPLSDFVDIADPVVALFSHDAPPGLVESWRDALTLVGAQTEVHIDTADDTVVANGILTTTQRAMLADTLREFLE